MSAYVYYNAELYSAEFDRVLLTLVGSFTRSTETKSLVKRYFFVRYADDRPHVRLRVLPRDEASGKELRQLLPLHIENWAATTPVGAYGGWRWQHYVPEIARYGGPAALEVCEEFFHASSEFVLGALDVEFGSRDRRLGIALLAMLAFTHAITPDLRSAIRLLRDYGEGYIRTIARDRNDRMVQGWRQQAAARGLKAQDVLRAVWKSLSEDSLGDPNAAVYRDACHALLEAIVKLDAKDLDAIGCHPGARLHDRWVRTVSSLIHMTNNRIGVSIPEEVLLSLAAVTALDDRLFANSADEA